ncbi:hypothetical protein MHYP_G00074180 [Metynnis hypsauchen]
MGAEVQEQILERKPAPRVLCGDKEKEPGHFLFCSSLTAREVWRIHPVFLQRCISTRSTEGVVITRVLPDSGPAISSIGQDRSIALDHAVSSLKRDKVCI